MKFRKRFLPYAVAISSTAIALLLTFSVEPFLPRTIGAFFYIAIIVTAWYGGLRPGFVAVVLSTVAINYWFIPPRYQFWTERPEDAVQLVIFLLVAFLINLLTSNFRDSKQKIERLSQQLAQENAELLRIAPSAAQMGMWNWDIATGKLQWSPDHELLFGLTPGTFDGEYETAIACLHPDDRESVNQAVQQAIQNNSLYQQEFRVVWADGSIHWIEARGHAFYNEAGQPIQMTGTATAIDRRKQAQGLLEQQFEQQRLIMEMTQRIRRSLNLHDILQTTVDEVRQCLECDRVVIFQFAPNWSGTVVVESVGADWTTISSTEIYDPCFGEQYVEPYKQGLITVKSDIYNAGIDPCHLELLSNFQVRANLVVPIVKGDELWGLLIAHHCAAPRQWQSSEIDLLRQLAAQVSIAIQQSELFEQVQTELEQRKQLEVALCESQIQLQHQLAQIEIIYQSAPIGLNVLDTELRFVRINERLAQMNGLSIEAHIGRTIREVVPDLADAAEQLLRPILETGEPLLNVEITGETPAQPGVQQTWLESFLPLKDGDRIIGISTVCEDITKRKHAEMELQQLNAELEQRVRERTAELTEVNDRLLEALIALRESEERRRLALDLTHIGFWDFHLASGKLIWNDNLFTLHGLVPHSIEPSYELCRSLVHPDDVGWVEQRFLESVQNHTDYVVEYRVVHPDGSVHWVMGRGTAIYDESGQPMRSLGVVLDISDRKRIEVERQRAEESLQQAHAQLLQRTAQLEIVNQELHITLEELQSTEEELRESNHQLEATVLAAQLQRQRYEDLFNFAPDGYLLTDSSGVIQEANQAAGNLLFASSFALVGKPLSLYICDEHRRLFFTSLTQLQQLFGRQTYELTIKPRQGNSFPAAIAASTMRDQQGQMMGIRWLIKDISDRKQAEEELRQSEAKFRSLSESSPLGIFMTDIGGQCIYINPRYQVICGCTFDEALGDGWVQFIHPEEREQVATGWSSAVSQRQEFRSEIRFVHKDGTLRFGRVSSAPIFSVADEVIGYVGTVEDITDSRAVETMKKEFISIVSHELRTPLTSIRGSLGLVAAGVFKNKPEAAQQMLDIALHDTERLVRLVNDILDLERL